MLTLCWPTVCGAGPTPAKRLFRWVSSAVFTLGSYRQIPPPPPRDGRRPGVVVNAAVCGT